MAGKSTYMRQVALITLMAQMGSFVPATSANISICDKIFTRIGASDDLAGGKSTFMVEMWEVSNILKNATSNSLVLLDEVGRGTSTYDGLSIAWSVIEYITKNKDLRCKTLFATHYHELVKLEGILPGVKNYSVAVKKLKDSVVFLRKIVEGGADESYGIEVAKLAGLPENVINRAREILEDLEGKNTFDINKVSSCSMVSNNIKEIAVDSTKNSEDKVISNAQNIDVNETSCKDTTKEKILRVETQNAEYEEAIKSLKSEITKLQELNKKHNKKHKDVSNDNMQINFEVMEKENFIKELSEVDILGLNPMEAMNTLYRLVTDAKKLQ